MDTELSPLPSSRAMRRILVGLATMVGAIVAVNLSPLMGSWSVRRLLDLNGEITVAAWLSSAILLAVAGVAAVIAVYESALDRSRGRRAGWWTMAALFVALSADEAAMLHELTGIIASRRLGEVDALPGVFLWVVVMAPVGLALAVGLFRWLRSTMGWRSRHGRMGLAALGIWALVPVLEVLDPRLGAPVWLHVLEETAEFGGEILMLGCVLGYLRQLQRHHPLALVLQAPSEEPRREARGADPRPEPDETRRVA